MRKGDVTRITRSRRRYGNPDNPASWFRYQAVGSSRTGVARILVSRIISRGSRRPMAYHDEVTGISDVANQLVLEISGKRSHIEPDRFGDFKTRDGMFCGEMRLPNNTDRHWYDLSFGCGPPHMIIRLT